MKNITYIGIIISVLFLMIGTTQATWVADTNITKTPFILTYGAPVVFQKDDQLQMIEGTASGTFEAFTWDATQSQWIVNSTLKPWNIDVGSDSKPTVFQIEGIWYLISGENMGGFYGFQWNASQSQWIPDSNIINGLNNQGVWSSPTAFYKNNQLYLISGTYNGDFHGYSWGGTSWSDCPNIINGLNSIGQGVTPFVFKKDNGYHLIAGTQYGAFIGYTYNNTQWIWTQNQSLIEGLYDIGWGSALSVFQMDNNWYLLSGENNNIYGFKWIKKFPFSSMLSTPEITPTLTVTPVVTPEITPEITPEPTPNVTATPTPTPEPTPEITPEPTPTPTPTVTVTSSSGSSSGSSSSGSSSGGGGSPSEPHKNMNKSYKVEKYIYRDTPAIYNFSKAGMMISEIDIASDVNIPEVEIKIEELKNTSLLTNATPLEGASYYNIWINTKRFKNATINFNCNDNPSLMRWNNDKWEPIDTNECKAVTNLSTTFAFTTTDATKENVKKSYLQPLKLSNMKNEKITSPSIEPFNTQHNKTSIETKKTILSEIINWLFQIFNK